jgi:hypothetical protein
MPEMGTCVFITSGGTCIPQNNPHAKTGYCTNWKPIHAATPEPEKCDHISSFQAGTADGKNMANALSCYKCGEILATPDPSSTKSQKWTGFNPIGPWTDPAAAPEPKPDMHESQCSHCGKGYQIADSNASSDSDFCSKYCENSYVKPKPDTPNIPLYQSGANTLYDACRQDFDPEKVERWLSGSLVPLSWNITSGAEIRQVPLVRASDYDALLALFRELKGKQESVATFSLNCTHHKTYFDGEL